MFDVGSAMRMPCSVIAWMVPPCLPTGVPGITIKMPPETVSTEAMRLFCASPIIAETRN